MDSPKLSSFLFLAAISLSIASSDAYIFDVGGEDGWTEHPDVTYEQWSEKHNFAVNDTLFFKYKREDSVLQVSKEAFDTCNNSAPFWEEDDGKSFFTLNKTGPFYFISGNKEHCDKGQKLSVNVTSGAPPSPAPAHSPSHAPSPAPSHAPSPAPSHAPSPAPSHAPSPAPSHAPSPAPSLAPSPAPSPEHPESPTPESSAASVVLGTPAFTAALMGFVFGLMVVF